MFIYMCIYNIMKMEIYSSEIIKHLLSKQKIATLEELKAALQTEVSMTVYRKLQELAYMKSYSDRGKYYTLSDIPVFDRQGLWAYKSVRFSRIGTLIDTIEHFINVSDTGYFEQELEDSLSVSVRAPLLKLWHDGRIAREKLAGRLLYHSVAPGQGMQQLRLRRQVQEDRAVGIERVDRELLHHELKAAIILFFSLLDEQQRRLYAGLESLMCGYGGDRAVADLLGIDEHTVAKGRNSILERDIETERIRKQGGGRKATKKNS
jgi:DNA-binding transcriptional regulator YdaS (Cro superfamily)